MLLLKINKTILPTECRDNDYYPVDQEVKMPMKVMSFKKPVSFNMVGKKSDEKKEAPPKQEVKNEKPVIQQKAPVLKAKVNLLGKKKQEVDVDDMEDIEDYGNQTSPEDYYEPPKIPSRQSFEPNKSETMGKSNIIPIEQRMKISVTSIAGIQQFGW